MSGRVKSGRAASTPLDDTESSSGGGPRPEARRNKALSEGSKRDEKTGGGKVTAQPSKDVSKHRGENQADLGSGRHLTDYRDQVVREMTGRGKRPSPIQEERSMSPTPPSSVPIPTTTSTESGRTIRGGMTPGLSAKTPSYPFPRMGSPGFVPTSMHRPFTTLSPTGSFSGSHSGQQEGIGLLDKVLSNPSTPASTMTFLPGDSSRLAGEHSDFASPNLYDLSLMLSAEPGLDAWWNTVVQIMKDCYQAERVALAVPADSTDIENVPWGQKATYNTQEKDDLSLRYMARGSSLVPSSTADTPTTPQQSEVFGLKLPLRPGLPSRHSFTSYEDKKEKKDLTANARHALARPIMPRSKSTYPTSSLRDEVSMDDTARISLNQSALQEHDAVEEEQGIPSWNAPLLGRQESQGRMLPMLQALEYEADPLIDHSGIQRVLDRGKLIALTRSYPYLDPETPERPDENMPTGRGHIAALKKKSAKIVRSDSSKISSFLETASQSKEKRPNHRKRASGGGLRPEDDIPRPRTPRYEEYEQAPPSPWSQSPAPSPAIRGDPQENPFFTDAMVDEESFNPSSPVQDYAGLNPLETIGVENSWTVLHIPLTHPILSKPTPTFKLDATMLEQKTSSRGKADLRPADPTTLGSLSPDPTSRRKPTPIAILSILSPIIPYPSNLRHSIEHLAAHMATSFSLCRHYTNLEVEVSGLHRRGPGTGGFGAVGFDGRPLANPSSLTDLSYLPRADLASQQSLAGSITSPSEYSGPTRSATDSPGGTPGWESGTLGLVMEKRPVGTSPSQSGGDSYFSTRPASSSGRPVTTPGGSLRVRRNSKDLSTSEKRLSLRTSGSKVSVQEPDPTSPDITIPDISGDLPGRSSEELPTIKVQQKRVTVQDVKESPSEHKVPKAQEGQDSQRRTDVSQSAHASHQHSQLHSYGADFSMTFQSLPPSSSVSVKGMPRMSAPSRTGSVSSNQADMPPPSDRLKGLMLDSLPAHVFVAMPQTGAVVWVNSRYLSYRGQTVEGLAENPWASIHPDDRDDYLKAWSHSIRTGDPFSRTVRIRRFDGRYRWFQARAVASRDKRNIITQFLGSYMDIHDQHIAELNAARQEEIAASEANHKLLANLIPQIIFTATEDEGITFANDQWLSYTGQSQEDTLGLGFMDFVHPEDLAKCRIPVLAPLTAQKLQKRGKGKNQEVPYEAVSKAIRQGMSRNSSSGSSTTQEPIANELLELAKKGIVKVGTDSSGRLTYTTELRLRTKSDEYRWHLIRCVEIGNVDFGSGASSYFGSATDINDHKLLEAKLKEAMESKGRFLSNMSHEIRTPLIGISGMVSFLQDTTLNEEQRDYTNTIQTSANNLLMIINDILDLSKVDAGMMKLNFEWFHTRSLIEDVNELVSTMAIAKRLELNYVVEEEVPIWVKGDRVRIRQVLLNVIGNAIKFTAQGEVFSRCRVHTDANTHVDKNEIMLDFSIIDTGRGFTQEEAELIFKPFSQIDGSSTRQHGGSGLGLVISRQLVELHGGKMDGSAVLGKGSTFTFSAKFALPTEADHPEIPTSPVRLPSAPPYAEELHSSQPFKNLVAMKAMRTTPIISPTTELVVSPALASSGSSDPSIRSGSTRITERSSMSSVNAGLARFSEAARASGQDLSQMKLEMPSERGSPSATPTPDNPMVADQATNFRPPMYSILIICPQTHSREATTKHIEMTLPKDVPHQITSIATIAEAYKLIGQEDPVIFTHIVINLPSSEEIIGLVEQLDRSTLLSKAIILILSDSVQRQAIIKQAANTKYDELLSEQRVTYIYKPVKPSRFAVIFDPAKERDISIDRNRSTAQRIVESQRQSYLDMEKRMGNKGYKVLLVEDNPVNQMVLQKYLKKVGVDVEVASDGVECTDTVFSHGHHYYSLILCDLHMPRKDGYQTCREIREWEAKNKDAKMPIVALSANVMSDVQEKCIEAGFSDYVTKPIDFIDLSRALSKFF